MDNTPAHKVEEDQALIGSVGQVFLYQSLFS